MHNTYVVLNEKTSESVVVSSKIELNDAVQDMVDNGYDADDITIYEATDTRYQIITKVEVEFY